MQRFRFLPPGLALLLGLAACGQSPIPITPSQSSDSSTDDEEGPSETFTFGADTLSAQSLHALGDGPLKVTFGIYRARSGLNKGWLRARAKFENQSGAQLSGTVHLEVQEVQSSALVGAPFEKKLSLTAGTATTRSTVSAQPNGWQCAVA